MAIVNANQPVLLVNTQLIPSEGPKAFPVQLDFSGLITDYDLDLLIREQTGFLEMVQTIFVDNADNPATLVISINGSNQRIVVPANKQGYFQVLVPNPVKMHFSSSAGGPIVPVFLINVPIPSATW